jgi:hypothetical protein
MEYVRTRSRGGSGADQVTGLSVSAVEVPTNRLGTEKRDL